MLRQVYPVSVNPSRPSELRREADYRWQELPQEIIDKEDQLVSSFEEAHDLANAFDGYSGLPALWLLRDGSEYIVETSGLLSRLTFASVRSTLEKLGDVIAQRLSSDSGQWGGALAAWASRYNSDQVGLLAWSTGINRTLAQRLISDGTLHAPVNFEDAANDNDEMRIAARMVGTLPPEQIHSILILARQFDRRDAPRLTRLAADCQAHLSRHNARSKAYIQGDVIARFARECLQLKLGVSVDIFQLVSDLGIMVRTSGEEPQSLLGLAIWGQKFGPGVFLNETSTAFLHERGPIKMQERPASRVTLAHELCHLLLDGEHAFSAIEILQARMSVNIERRAKSFAGEFLLPKAAAGEAWIKAKRPTGRPQVELVVNELARAFGVTRKVAAWKLEHGAHLYHTDLTAVLDTIEPHR